MTNECQGHESTDGANMGRSVYCDGRCERVRLERARATYRTLRARVIAKTGETAADFDRRAASVGTQDGEGEPPTARDYLEGAREIAFDLDLLGSL